jgi:hypothetical protein
MFKRLFNKKAPKPQKDISKDEYWKQWELFQLFEDLSKGEKLLNDTVNNNPTSELLKFRSDYIEELNEVKGDNVADFTRIWEWFKPCREWENLVGKPGKKISNNIFRILDRWKRNQDFLIGTKVSLDGDFGVVLDKTEDWNEYGFIRWDTNKVNDVEDWRGLFGSFLQAGGCVISQEHEFKYINDDGTIKASS